MSYPPDPNNPNNPYGQPQQAPYGVPPQQNPYGQPPQAGYGYPQQPPAGYGIPPQGMPPQGPYGGYAPAPPVLASWGARVGAFLLDGLIIGLPLIIGYIIGGVMLVSAVKNNCQTDPTTGLTDCSNTTAGASSGGLAVIGITFLLTLGLALWQTAREGSTGQTIGKKALGLRLVREADGKPLGFGMAFVRRLAHFVDGAVCYIGYLWPLWDSKGQTFADKIVSSLVIRAQ
ncbi:putative RDD family membrane protein YckC [Kitasatospora sp. MAP12-15]|uniref:RDD family protein n=1 Tax=unclassified Kitasatospora TaxID=2633591 RepID=UPI002476E935|nr:RDD family protein [Kitasatospora sp. MAP12-44]MDH6110905.1 putative RDD family membrane protein YckC [Kitasatospora sp. MAP12-44]